MAAALRSPKKSVDGNSVAQAHPPAERRNERRFTEKLCACPPKSQSNRRLQVCRKKAVAETMEEIEPVTDRSIRGQEKSRERRLRLQFASQQAGTTQKEKAS